jgi:hypothetical protein
MPDLVGSDHVNGLKGGLVKLRSVVADFKKKFKDSQTLAEFEKELDGIETDIGKIEPGTTTLDDKAYKKPLERLTAAAKEAKKLKEQLASEQETEQPWEIVYEAPKRLFDSAAQKIIAEAASRGPAYGTPGPKNLGRHARHHHVGRDNGVAFEFDEAKHQLKILGYGTKHGRGKGKGDSEYDWETK